MYTLRKILARQAWLVAVIGFTLLAQVQQSLACDLMMDTSMPAGESCPTVSCLGQQIDADGNNCCDLSSPLSLKAGFCNDDHESVISLSLSGKLNQDSQSVLITVATQDLSPTVLLTLLINNPDRESSHPGTHTYLATQRLRI